MQSAKCRMQNEYKDGERLCAFIFAFCILHFAFPLPHLDSIPAQFIRRRGVGDGAGGEIVIAGVVIAC